MMNDTIPRCARHEASPTSFTCSRCGTFGCIDCERRPGMDAAAMCPACWVVNAQAFAKPSSQLQTAGLVVGAISMIPCLPIAFASVVLNVIAIIKSTREHRWKPIVGLCITLSVVVLQVLFFAFYAMFSKPR